MSDITLSLKNSGGLMKRLTTIMLFAAILVVVGTSSSFALQFRFTNNGSINATDRGLILNQLNGVGSQFEKIDRPTKLTGAFADAATYSNSAATQRGYGNYDIFAFTLGAMVGAQLPGNDQNALENISTDLEKNGDAEIGINMQVAGQLGINCSSLIDGLYLGVRYGSIKRNQDFDDEEYDFDAFAFGIVANYRLFEASDIGFGVIKWRGISLGSGLMYQRTRNEFGISGNQLVNVGSYYVNPDLTFSLKTTTFSVPLEMTTAIRLLWAVNFHVGVGADLQLVSKSELALKSDALVTGGGTARVSASEKMTEHGSIFKPKFMCGFGIGIADIFILDVPITYYVGDGVNIGFSMGTVW